MCHHELCPTLVSDPVQLSYTEAAPWLYKKNGLWLLSEEDFSWNCYTGTLSLSVDFIYWYPILEEVFTDLAWITRSQDSFPME